MSSDQHGSGPVPAFRRPGVKARVNPVDVEGALRMSGAFTSLAVSDLHDIGAFNLVWVIVELCAVTLVVLGSWLPECQANLLCAP